MAGAQFTIPLITVIPGQLITAALWNNEWTNVGTNLNPLGLDGYQDTDSQMQIQTDPYPGSVTSHASSLGGEIERIRFQISAILGATTPAYWYADAPTDLTTLSNVVTNVITPIGGVIDYPSATPPSTNWLLANGQAINRVTYATLYTLIGTTFGIGDGTTTFNVPNYTDRFSITAGNTYALAATGGATTHALSVPEMPQHNHTITDPQHLHTEYATSNGGGVKSVQAFTGDSSQQATAQLTGSASTGITINNTGSGSPHSILNPYLAMYKMIRAL